MLLSNHNDVLVLLSTIVAILASYTALDMAGRMTTAKGKISQLWLFGSATSMGIGIWSMRFIGMLAFSLPIPIGYDPLVAVLSMIIAISSSTFALWLACNEKRPKTGLLLGALLMGGGIAAMHYTGMTAMRMELSISQSVPWVALSILISIVASGVAMWMAFHLRHYSPHIKLLRIGAATLMGLAIVAVHYIDITAADFPRSNYNTAIYPVDNNWLSLLVAVVTLAILTITLIISVLYSRLQIRTSTLASSLAQANRELTQLALHDNLTKLPNRLLLEDRLTQAFQKATQGEYQFAVLFMDLDGFKAINDAFGHHIGDQLLIAVTQRIQHATYATDTLARIGGDEFVFLTEITDPNNVSMLADKLVSLIAKPFYISRYELLVTISIGIVIYPGDGENERELILNADAAMYHTKNANRNGYSYFQPSMNANAQNQLQLLNDLRMALDYHEFRLFYQPKFAAPSGPISGFEALLRWERHGKILSPDSFLSIAEKTGLIIPIGEWVINEACRQLHKWHQEGHRHWTVAVNLSTLQFEQANLVDMVMSAIARHQIPPSMLTLEVTETTAMRDPESSIAILKRLTSYGVKASIDDFGTGYSSLLYLKRFPASELKIDGAFINELATNKEDACIVKAIIALCQALKLKVVAEGVETPQQRDLLTQLGCDTLQGYLLGRPMTPQQISEHLFTD